MAVQRKLQVVTVNAMQRIAHGTVFHAVALDDLQQRAALAVRHIVKPHLFAVLRNLLVIVLKDRCQLLHEGTAAGIDLLALCGHLFLPYLHQLRIGLPVFHLQ